jgi:hypothetical protein
MRISIIVETDCGHRIVESSEKIRRNWANARKDEAACWEFRNGCWEVEISTFGIKVPSAVEVIGKL